jgi:hypothetical protein
MKSLIVFVLLSTSICWNVNGQEKSQQRDIVMYDPLFWKEKLSLKTSQYRKIQEINREFYDELRRFRQMPVSKTEMKNQLNVELQERSSKIWATLDNKQKRKLERILEQTTLRGPQA